MSARKLTLAGFVSLCVFVGASLFASTSAFAVSPPVLGGVSALNVSATSATLQAEVNPEGSATTYHFEYGTSEAYGQSIPVPDDAAGAGTSLVAVEAHAQGLQPDTTYHFRVVANNVGGVQDSADDTFVTQHGGGALGLPDSREWELVSPPDKHGALFYGLYYGAFSLAKPFVTEASSAGDAIVDLASQPSEAEPEGNSNEASVLMTRGSSGWSSQVLTPPHAKATTPTVGEGLEYRFFSEDLSQGIVQPVGTFTPWSPEASESTPYLRSDYLNGNVTEHCQSSCYSPLVTRANTQPGVEFGEENGGVCPHTTCGPHFLDATPDAKHVILRSHGQLTSTPNVGVEDFYYYEWSDGRLQPLWTLPANEGGGAVYAGGVEEAAGESGPTNEEETMPVSHWFSNDGSIFFTYNGHVYLHDVVKGESLRLDVAQGVAEPGGGGAEFLYASSDGSEVLFSDPQQLTSAAGGGIYECRIVEVASKLTCELELTGLSGDVRRIGGSGDASYLYFVNAEGKLLVNHYDGSKWTTTDGPFVGAIAAISENRGTASRVSSNGRFVAFVSSEDLTGYDNRDTITGLPDFEVYLYSAGTNRLVCASCNPTAARPVGTEYTTYADKGNRAMLVGGALEPTLSGEEVCGRALNCSWAAANLPQWTEFENKSPIHQPRYLSDSGRLFFDSNDALVSQDVNGTEDVYQYEPVGGSCSTSSETFSERSDGCVDLISSGSSPEESAFLDASESGGDVFFISQAKLVSQDLDNTIDLYDAHECTSAMPCFPVDAVQPPACITEASCRVAPTPQPPIFGSPSSATFSGAGNVIPSGPVPVVKSKALSRAQKLTRALKVCRRKGSRRRAVCERRARKQYGVAKSGKSSAKRKGR